MCAIYELENGLDNPALEFLIKAGADLNLTDNEGKTALMHAKDKNNEKAVELLELAGAKIHTPDDSN